MMIDPPSEKDCTQKAASDSTQLSCNLRDVWSGVIRSSLKSNVWDAKRVYNDGHGYRLVSTFIQRMLYLISLITTRVSSSV